MNRGESWQSFEMPLPPAMIGRPLSFHSDPKKWGYILYQGTACDKSGGWGATCHDEVREHATRYLTTCSHSADLLHKRRLQQRLETAHD